MEFTITEKINESPTICLNMIVKDESHIIKGTLERLCNKIKFDYSYSRYTLAGNTSLFGLTIDFSDNSY